MAEVKAITVFRKRMKAEGRLTEFNRLYKELVGQGWATERALEVAMERMITPPDVSRGARVEPVASQALAVQSLGFPDSSNNGGGVADLRLDPASFEGKSETSIFEDVLWVYKHIGFDPGSLDPEDAPSGGAWAMLIHFRHEDRIQSFYQYVVTKLLPNRSQIESNDERMSDDGRDLDDHITAILAMAGDARGG